MKDLKDLPLVSKLSLFSPLCFSIAHESALACGKARERPGTCCDICEILSAADIQLLLLSINAITVPLESHSASCPVQTAAQQLASLT